MLEVSIIIPVKATKPHHLTWLNEAIYSVADQTALKSCEVIIVDDHSEIDLDPVKSKWERIMWLDATGDGVANARNEAAEAARAPLLLPLDSDDKLSPQAVDSFLKAWYNHKDKIIYSDVVMFSEDVQRAWLAPEYNFDELLHHTTILVSSLHRKSDWQKVGGWRMDMEQGLEDWEYWIAMGEMGVCGFHVNEFLLWYRMNPGGRMSRLKSDGQREFQEAKLRLRDLHRDTYDGRRPMGCCPGGAVSGVQGAPNRPNRQAQLNAIMRDGERVGMEYIGPLAGSWQATGPTGVTYNISGKGAIVTDNDGKPGVLKQDVAFLMSYPGSFRRVDPKPKPQAKPKVVQGGRPAPAPSLPAKAEVLGKEGEFVDIDPDMATDKHADELNFDAPIPDPGDHTAKEIQKMDLTPDMAYVMLGLEEVGKDRSTVVKHLKKVAGAQ